MLWKRSELPFRHSNHIINRIFHDVLHSIYRHTLETILSPFPDFLLHHPRGFKNHPPLYECLTQHLKQDPPSLNSSLSGNPTKKQLLSRHVMYISEAWFRFSYLSYSNLSKLISISVHESSSELGRTYATINNLHSISNHIEHLDITPPAPIIWFMSYTTVEAIFWKYLSPWRVTDTGDLYPRFSNTLSIFGYFDLFVFSFLDSLFPIVYLRDCSLKDLHSIDIRIWRGLPKRKNRSPL